MDNREKREEKLKYFVRKGFLLDKDVLEFFTDFDDDKLGEEILSRVFSITKERVITRKLLFTNIKEFRHLLDNLEKNKKTIIDNFFSGHLMGPETSESEKTGVLVKKEVDRTPNSPIKILSSNIIPYRKIEVKDFVTHFKNRYNFLKEILKERKELQNLVSINKIGNNRTFSIIGLVASKRITKNKNIILEVEDLSGKISALITQEKEAVFQKAKEIVIDDVIALRCNGGGEIIYVSDVFFADCYLAEKMKTDDEVYALFTSDSHVGSTLFKKDNFERFINWISGEGYDEEHKKKISKIKYLFLNGDNVDGVGVYPGQEALLSIKDIKDQYKELARYLQKIPKHIGIIICPGQHDAVRVPEPQPPLDEEFAEDLIKMHNVFLVSNPTLIEIESTNKKRGFKVLMYHGASMHSWIDEIEDLRTGQTNLNPTKAIKYMLRHRHLSPMHSGNTYVPSEKEDPLIIKEVPDVIAVGDMHRTDIDLYNNVLIICGGCWQSMTAFEEKIGNIPDPCKVPMLNLKTREIKILDFSNL